jgi:TRAP-type C4-dicarboxylate transport system permease small subunit
MRGVHYIKQFNDLLAALLKGLLIAVFTLLVFVVIWGVASRYLLGDQASWSEELARLLMVWLALLGAALVTREDQHLGLDALVRCWPAEVQLIGRLITYLLVFLFAALIMALGGFQLVLQRFEFGQTLPALGISKAWFYLALPVSGILTSLFVVELFLQTLRGESPVHPPGKGPLL